MHHVCQIPVAFLDMEERGEALTYEALTEPPPMATQPSSSSTSRTLDAIASTGSSP